MIITKKHFIPFFLLSLLVSCNSPQIAKIKVESDSRSISKTYKEPVFATDKSLEKIKGITTQMHAFIEEHAK